MIEETPWGDFEYPVGAVERSPNENKQAMEIIELHGLKYLKDLRDTVFSRGPKDKDKMIVNLGKTNRGPLWKVLDSEMHTLFDNKIEEYYPERGPKHGIVNADDLLGLTTKHKKNPDNLGEKSSEEEAELENSKRVLMSVVRDVLNIIAKRIAVDNFLEQRQRVFVVSQSGGEATGKLDKDLVEKMKIVWGRVAKNVVDDVKIVAKENPRRGEESALYAVLGEEGTGQNIIFAFSKRESGHKPEFYPYMREGDLEKLLDIFIKKMDQEIIKFRSEKWKSIDI